MARPSLKGALNRRTLAAFEFRELLCKLCVITGITANEPPDS